METYNSIVLFLENLGSVVILIIMETYNSINFYIMKALKVVILIIMETYNSSRTPSEVPDLGCNPYYNGDL